MLARINFVGYQQVNQKELDGISETLSDEISVTPLVKKNDGTHTSFSSWSHTLDPEDLNKPDNKKELVYKSELFHLDQGKEYIADLDLFLAKHPSIKITMRGVIKTIANNNYNNVISQMLAIQKRMEDALAGFDQQVEFNQKCDVHIANLGLLTINQVGYAENYCTEQLQEVLNKGWKIIACCVQNDSRRPDYIMGRYIPTEEFDGNVKCIKF